MIYLASSSPSRAKILENAKISFKQIIFNYDESVLYTKNALSYPATITALKAKQFFAYYGSRYDRVLFADSSVICGDLILGKAKNENEARQMLALQSANAVSVASAMKFVSSKLCLDALSVTSFIFNEFKKSDLDEYIASGLWRGKAGAMMIEGFNGRYIKKQHGSQATAMGLDIDILLNFLH